MNKMIFIFVLALFLSNLYSMDIGHSARRDGFRNYYGKYYDQRQDHEHKTVNYVQVSDEHSKSFGERITRAPGDGAIAGTKTSAQQIVESVIVGSAVQAFRHAVPDENARDAFAVEFQKRVADNDQTQIALITKLRVMIMASKASTITERNGIGMVLGVLREIRAEEYYGIHQKKESGTEKKEDGSNVKEIESHSADQKKESGTEKKEDDSNVKEIESHSAVLKKHFLNMSPRERNNYEEALLQNFNMLNNRLDAITDLEESNNRMQLYVVAQDPFRSCEKHHDVFRRLAELSTISNELEVRQGLVFGSLLPSKKDFSSGKDDQLSNNMEKSVNMSADMVVALQWSSDKSYRDKAIEIQMKNLRVFAQDLEYCVNGDYQPRYSSKQSSIERNTLGAGIFGGVVGAGGATAIAYWLLAGAQSAK